MASISAVAFDSYGTLFDVNSALARHAARLGERWQTVAQEIRAKQLEYTWVRSLAGQYHDFARITDDALGFVAAEHGLTDPALLSQMRDAYDFPDAFPEAAGVLAELRDRGLPRAVLSNGSPAMLAHALRTAKCDGLLDAVWSVEPVAAFKPDPRVYQLAVDGFGVHADRIAFVSANAWDAFGAHAFGFRVFWINRKQKPDEYGLRGAVTELPDLGGLPALLAA